MYKSLAQAAFFNRNRKLMEAKGVNVDEFNAKSKGKLDELPTRATPARKPRRPRGAVRPVVSKAHENSPTPDY
jgi:hypothetical protein